MDPMLSAESVCSALGRPRSQRHSRRLRLRRNRNHVLRDLRNLRHRLLRELRRSAINYLTPEEIPSPDQSRIGADR
jgi:hypothetical protein